MHIKRTPRRRGNNPRNEKRKHKIIKFVKNLILNFSFDKEKVKDLIDLIIQEPTEDEFKRGHKYPFVSSELLNCDTQKLLDYFICTNEELVKKERKSSTEDDNNQSEATNTKADSPFDGENETNEEEKEIDKEENEEKKEITEEKKENAEEKNNEKENNLTEGK